jgi:hypothetical protein
LFDVYTETTLTAGGGPDSNDPNRLVEYKHGVRKIYQTLAGAESKDTYQRTHEEVMAGAPSQHRDDFIAGTTAINSAARTFTTISSGDQSTWMHGGPPYWQVILPEIAIPSNLPIGTTDHSIMRSQATRTSLLTGKISR